MGVERKEPGVLDDVAETAGMTDRAEGRPEPMKHALKDMHDEADSMREQTESGASMDHVISRLLLVLNLFMDTCLTAGRTRQQAVKRDRSMLRIPLKCWFERGKGFHVQG